MFLCYYVFKKILCLKKNDIMSKEEMKYEAAFAQLQDIVRKMENDEYSIDEIAVQLKEAQRLIKFCKDKLTKTEEEILKIQSETP